ncbi:MAG: hypothetical protein ACKVS6_00840 [Planctomycetota bacterium]
MPKLPVIVLSTLTLATIFASQAAAQNTAKDYTDPKIQQKKAVEWFAHQPGGVQTKILKNVRDILAKTDDPYLAGIRSYATLAASHKPKELKFQSKISPDGSFPIAKELPFPMIKEYIFGARIIRPVDSVKGKEAPKRADELNALLNGMAPDLDLALAQILSELDHDKSADEFALFLESWRNGDESFYRALDRTAGTPGEVFYYDAMLGEFNAKFLKGEDFVKFPKAKKNLAEAHDALHSGFLTYRQYRALREAMALTCVLPPDAALPKNLARYEEKPEGAYSIRDEMQMLLVAYKFDISKAAADFAAWSPPLPTSLWGAQYDPVSPFHTNYNKKQLVMNDDPKIGSSPVLLKKFGNARAAAAKLVTEAAIQSLQEAGCPPYRADH